MTRHPMRMHNLLLPCFVLLGLVAVQSDALALGSTPVTVTNPADIAKAEGVQTPFYIDMEHPANSSQDGIPRTYFVPSNQRLIIEYVSGVCDVVNGSVDEFGVLVQGTMGGRNFFNFPRIAFTQNDVFQTFGHPVKIYAPPGSTVTLLGNTFAAPGGAANCEAFLSGQLVDVP